MSNLRTVSAADAYLVNEFLKGITKFYPISTLELKYSLSDGYSIKFVPSNMSMPVESTLYQDFTGLSSEELDLLGWFKIQVKQLPMHLGQSQMRIEQMHLHYTNQLPNNVDVEILMSDYQQVVTV